MIVDIDKIVAEARSHIGKKEATGRNDGEFVERVLGGHGERGNAWCAAFALRCYEWGGAKLPVNFWMCRRVATLYDALERDGAVLGPHEPPEPGDIAIWLGLSAHSASGASGHVGIVVDVRGRAIDVIEGNAGNAVALRRYDGIVHPRITAFARPSRLREPAR